MGLETRLQNLKGIAKEEIKEPFSNCRYKHFIMKLKSKGNPQFKLTNKEPSSNLQTIWYQKKEKAQSKGKPIQQAKKKRKKKKEKGY